MTITVYHFSILVLQCPKIMRKCAFVMVNIPIYHHVKWDSIIGTELYIYCNYMYAPFEQF